MQRKKELKSSYPLTHTTEILCRRYGRGELDDLDDLYKPDEDVEGKLAGMKQRERNEVGRKESDTKPSEDRTNLAIVEKSQPKKEGWGNIRLSSDSIKKAISLPAGRGIDVLERATKVNGFNGSPGFSGQGRMLLR